LRIRVKSGSIRDRLLSFTLIAAIVVAIGILGYTVTNPPRPERFTEFYILGLNNEAVDYPVELTIGEEGKVIVGIINREQETVSYNVKVVVDYVIGNEIEPVTLEYDEKWEQVISFTPHRVGANQKVEFLLYKLDKDEVYQKLHLWIDVTE